MRKENLIVAAAVAFSCAAFASQEVGSFGQYHGISVYVSKAKGVGDDLVVKMARSNLISIETHERPNLFRVFKVEDLNNDKVLEIWASSYEGEGLRFDLYQIDLRRMQKAAGKSAVIKSGLTVFTASRDPFKDTILVKDIDGDGLVELMVKTPTHPFYGSLYSAGEIEWTDIYQLTPTVKLANEKFKQFYRNLSTEIKQEEQRVLSKIDELKREELQKREELHESGDFEVYFEVYFEVKIREANDQIAVYRTWLRKIEEIMR